MSGFVGFEYLTSRIMGIYHGNLKVKTWKSNFEKISVKFEQMLVKDGWYLPLDWYLMTYYIFLGEMIQLVNFLGDMMR